jgi:hypothetical protein
MLAVPQQPGLNQTVDGLARHAKQGAYPDNATSVEVGINSSRFAGAATTDGKKRLLQSRVLRT